MYVSDPTVVLSLSYATRSKACAAGQSLWTLMVPMMTNAGRADAVRGQDDVTACANAATTMTLRDEVSRGREREYGWPRRQQYRCACDKDSQPCDCNTPTTPLLLHALAPACTSSTTPA